jgi:hypothetical protein
MTVRHAGCSCGKLAVVVRGEPVRISVYESRKHPWVGLPDGIEHLD